MKHVKEFNKFLASEVNLDQGPRTRLNQRLRAVNEFLSQALDSYVKHEGRGPMPWTRLSVQCSALSTTLIS